MCVLVWCEHRVCVAMVWILDHVCEWEKARWGNSDALEVWSGPDIGCNLQLAQIPMPLHICPSLPGRPVQLQTKQSGKRQKSMPTSVLAATLCPSLLRPQGVRNMHHVMVCRWWSMTSALMRCSGWPVSKVCSVRAFAATSPFFRACRCSASRCLRVWSVCPKYTFWHPHTMPIRELSHSERTKEH